MERMPKDKFGRKEKIQVIQTGVHQNQKNSDGQRSIHRP